MKITDYQFVRMKGRTRKRKSHVPMLSEEKVENFSSPPSYYANSKIFTDVEEEENAKN